MNFIYCNARLQASCIHLLGLSNYSQSLVRSKVKHVFSAYLKCANASCEPYYLQSQSFLLQRGYHGIKSTNYLSSSSFHIESKCVQCQHKLKDTTENRTTKENATLVKESSPAPLPSRGAVDDDEKNLSLVKKFKLMYQRYWYVLLPVHVATSIVWYGSFFFAAKSGVDIVPILENVGAPEKILNLLRSSNAGYYGIAYAMYKIATPARYTVTLGGTTFAINYLKNRGYIKPVPTKEELKEMYADKKEVFIERTEEMREKYQEKRNELIEKYQDRTDEMKEKYQEKRNELIDKYSISKQKPDGDQNR